ncbi:MAG: hypothetical protein ACFFDP_12310 [Promethearchaeota archaeon]
MNEQPRSQPIASQIRLYLAAILIFALLLSGIGVIFIGKVTGQIATRFLILGIGLGVEIVAFSLIAAILYFRLIGRS